MIVDEDYIQTDGLIAENEHLHKIVAEQDKEIEKLKKNWEKLKEMMQTNIKLCYDYKIDCIEKQNRDGYSIADEKHTMYGLIYSSMIELEEGDNDGS